MPNFNRVSAQNYKKHTNKKELKKTIEIFIWGTAAWNWILLNLYLGCQCWSLSMNNQSSLESVGNAEALPAGVTKFTPSKPLVAGFLRGAKAVVRGPVHRRHLEVSSSVSPVAVSDHSPLSYIFWFWFVTFSRFQVTARYAYSQVRFLLPQLTWRRYSYQVN